MNAKSNQQTAKLFMNGRSQAVRLPKEFRMAGTKVNISRDGDKIILKPIAEKFDVDAWRAQLRDIGSEDFNIDLPEDTPIEPDESVSFDWVKE